MLSQSQYIMPKILLVLLSLTLLFYVCLNSSPDTTSQEPKDSQQDSEEKNIDSKRLSQVNELINSYFANCSHEAQSNLLYGCSIAKFKYAQFLYALFFKEHIMNFLKLYQSEGKISTQNDISSMYSIGQKVNRTVVSAYNQWIDIYKPNANITVEQMYQDIPDLDEQVFDVIQHYEQKYKDFIDVLRKIYNVERKAVEYVVMGNNSEEQIAEDYEGILRVYFGDCEPIEQCKMSLKAFVYFIKELSFYITPLMETQNDQKSILISQDLDFKATQFLLQEVENMKQILGNSVDYSEIQEYSEEIAMKLFEHLKDNRQQDPRENQPLEQQTGAKDKKGEL